MMLIILFGQFNMDLNGYLLFIFFGNEKAVKLFLFFIFVLASIFIFTTIDKKFQNKQYSLYAALAYLSLPFNFYLFRVCL